MLVSLDERIQWYQQKNGCHSHHCANWINFGATFPLLAYLFEFHISSGWPTWWIGRHLVDQILYCSIFALSDISSADSPASKLADILIRELFSSFCWTNKFLSLKPSLTRVSGATFSRHYPLNQDSWSYSPWIQASQVGKASIYQCEIRSGSVL